MEGLVPRLIGGLLMAVLALLVAWAALTIFDLPLAVAVVLGLTVFVASVVLAVTLAVRHDVRLLKNHALELTGYEAEINRRVDYLSTLVERHGGASPDELAKRMRGLAHEFAALGDRLDRLEASGRAPAPSVMAPIPSTDAPSGAPAQQADEIEAGNAFPKPTTPPDGPLKVQAPERSRAHGGSHVDALSSIAARPSLRPTDGVVGMIAPARRAAPAVLAPPAATSSERAGSPEPLAAEQAGQGGERAEQPGMRKVVDARTHRAAVQPVAPKPIRAEAAAQDPGSAASSADAADAMGAPELRRAVAGSDLVFHLIPVLSLPERRPDYYEAIQRLRLPDGSWLEPEPLLALTRKHALHSLVERKTLYSAARMLRSVKAMGKHMRLFSQLSVESLTEERGFNELRTFLGASSDLCDELILEISQDRFRALASEARQRLALVVDAGFSLSMGDVRDPDVDVATMRQLGFRFARARTTLLVGEPDPGGADSLALRLSTHRVALIAVGARDEQDVLALIDRDVAHAQGPALSPPRVVKDELLRGPSAPARSTPQRAALAS